MDNFKFIRRLGQGSYAHVWLARRKSDSRVVAVKQLKETVSSWEECKELAEVKYLSRLRDCPNVVKLLEVVRAKGHVFLVFEYGESNLYQTQTVLLGEAKQFSEPQVRWVAKQLLGGMQYIHHKGFMHRDVKPENILLHGSSAATGFAAKLCDFGQCKATDAHGVFTGYVATRWYRAPEIILRAPRYGPGVDMWALGALIAEMFTLRPIFAGSSELDMLFKICSVLGVPTGWDEGHRLAAAMGYSFPDVRRVGMSSLIPKASPGAIEFIETLLVVDPARRATVDDALRHPYLRGAEEEVRPLMPTLNPAQERAAQKAAQDLAAEFGGTARAADRDSDTETGGSGGGGGFGSGDAGYDGSATSRGASSRGSAAGDQRGIAGGKRSDGGVSRGRGRASGSGTGEVFGAATDSKASDGHGHNHGRRPYSAASSSSDSDEFMNTSARRRDNGAPGRGRMAARAVPRVASDRKLSEGAPSAELSPARGFSPIRSKGVEVGGRGRDGDSGGGGGDGGGGRVAYGRRSDAGSGGGGSGSGGFGAGSRTYGEPSYGADEDKDLTPVTHFTPLGAGRTKGRSSGASGRTPARSQFADSLDDLDAPSSFGHGGANASGSSASGGYGRHGTTPSQRSDSGLTRGSTDSKGAENPVYARITKLGDSFSDLESSLDNSADQRNTLGGGAAASGSPAVLGSRPGRTSGNGAIWDGSPSSRATHSTLGGGVGLGGKRLRMGGRTTSDYDDDF